ncbi:uncharacterized protein [Amphiura filiformis]|uniref:uncharacterized protein n=1 Tax=Amphiura filiformis TaxID=82378 RepID=UPI003B21D8BC
MAMINTKTFASVAPLILLIILGFCTDYIYGRSSGAPPSACTSNLTPGHGYNPQVSPSPYTLTPDITVYHQTTQRISVTVSWPSTRFLKGMMLQAQRKTGSKDPVGTWSIGTTDQNNYKLIQCDHAIDTISHASAVDKSGSVTFAWHPPSTTQVGDILFVASFVENYQTYWVQVMSVTVVDPCIPNPCEFGGVCLTGDSNTQPSFTCTCPSGLTGDTCNSCDSNPCLNGGICTASNSGYTCTCANGFSGVHCQNDACNPSPCVNSGICVRVFGTLGYQCMCTSGFTGLRCETQQVVPGCGSSTCMNEGTCYNGDGGTYICQCTEGFTGTHCETAKDACTDNPCQYNGTCVIAEQSTLGFTCMCTSDRVGTLCEQEENHCEPNPCYFGSTCIQDSNDPRGYQCNCVDGYTGSNCETQIVLSPCDSGPCQNGGECFQSAGDPPTYFCVCPDEYGGLTCDIVDPCLSDPCLNGATCNKVPATNDYHCTCTALYVGINCDAMINPCASTPCLNNGQCSYDTNGYTCACPQYFQGSRCEQQSTCSSAPCRNGGICEGDVNGYTCQCTGLYTGVNCETLDFNPCNLTPCGQNGACSASGTTFTCTCNLGWTGTRCSEPVCATGTCQNGGTCTPIDTVLGYVCMCPNGYAGFNCETIAPCDSNPCLNDGECILTSDSYTCNCLSSYTGNNCETEVNPCLSSPCGNGGTCRTTISSGSYVYACECPASFTGVRCQTYEDPCLSVTCQNGGTCQGTADGYTCLCHDAFSGTHCETIDPCSFTPCHNGGQCANSPDRRTFTCTCPPMYTGTNCAIPVNVCEPSPCVNGGICQVAGGSAVCFCITPFAGPTCSDFLSPCASGPCQNGGECTVNSNGYTCSCPDTHTGFNCETELVNVCDPSPCQNSGQCLSSGSTFTCACIPPYIGAICTDLNPCLLPTPPCENGGTCSYGGPGLYTCNCMTGYSGQQCEIAPCSPNPCQNGGQCTETGSGGYTCSCSLGFLGTTCNQPDTTCTINQPCLNGGVCRLTAPQQYECDCTNYYSGINCETYSDPCAANGPCVNGQCFAGVSSPTCLCGPTHRGTYCEIDRCTGTEAGCQNNGICISDTLVCDCPTGFTGTDCSETESLPPSFTNCPDSDLSFSLHVGTTTATIRVDIITARDTTNFNVPLEYEEGPDGLVFGMDLEVEFEEAYREGFQVVYSATDISRSRAECRFKIKLVDNETPTIECPGDIREVTTERMVPVIFEGVVATDNLGEPTITYSRTIDGQDTTIMSGSQFEADGLPKSVIANAKDSFDNEDFCQFTVTVYKQGADCTHFPEITYGSSSCTVNMEGIRECTVTCQEDYYMSVPSPARFTCRQSNDEGAWQPTPNPDTICLELSGGKLMKVVSVVFGIEEENCAVGTELFENGIKTDIIEALNTKGLCTLNNVNACNRNNYDINCNGAGNGRRRRAITDMTVDIGISAEVDDSEDDAAIRRDIDMLAEQIQILADMGGLEVEVNNEMIPSTEDASSVSERFMQTCLDGQMAVEGGCLSCPAGTFYNRESQTCEFCDANSYQEQEKQTSCNACPDDKVTSSTGSYALAQCKDKSTAESIWTTTLIAVIAAAGGLVILLVLLIMILCCCRFCCSDDDDFSDNLGNLTSLNKAYEEDDDDQEMTFTGTMENGRASVRTYQSIPVNGYAHTDNEGYTNDEVDDRMVRIPSMSASVYQNNYSEKTYMNGHAHMNGDAVPESPPPPPPTGAPPPPPPPPPM